MKLKDIIPGISGSIRTLYPERECYNIAILVAMHLGFTKTGIVTMGDEELDPAMEEQVGSIAKELSTGMPVQYVLGNTEFYGLKFIVDPSVLIPRPETEELVDLIIKENNQPGLKILDIGTGSGCIAICLARYMPEADVHATDTSQEALKTAGLNAAGNNVNVNFIHDDILNTTINAGEYDIVVSNPPYVTISEKSSMRMNVVGFEPSLALYVRDDDPLVYYRAIANTCRGLKEGGLLYLEINERFGSEVSELLINNGFIKADVIKDINNKNRIIRAEK